MNIRKYKYINVKLTETVLRPSINSKIIIIFKSLNTKSIYVLDVYRDTVATA